MSLPIIIVANIVMPQRVNGNISQYIFLVFIYVNVLPV